MKEFKDLEFETHPSGIGGTAAKMNFENGFGVSVIFGTEWYSNGIDTYEVAVLYNGSLTYNTHITDTVIGYISQDEVTEVMRKVQELT